MFLLHTYEDLRQYCRHFAEGGWTCLIVVGDAGVGKTRTMAEVLPSIRTQEDAGARWIAAHVSAFQLFKDLYNFRDRTFVLDDIDRLCQDRGVVTLLMSLCNTETTRRVYWATTHKDLEKEEIPREFDSKSKIALVSNKWETANESVRALADRSMVIRFAPSAAEVHKQVGTWFKDRVVYDYIGRRLDRIFVPSQRLYEKAQSSRLMKGDWKAWVEGQIALPNEFEVVKALRADPAYSFELQRIQQYSRITGKSRSSYFRIVEELKSMEHVNSGRAPKPKCPPRKRSTPTISAPVELDLRRAARLGSKATVGNQVLVAAEVASLREARGATSKRKRSAGGTEAVTSPQAPSEVEEFQQAVEIISVPMTTPDAMLSLDETSAHPTSHSKAS